MTTLIGSKFPCFLRCPLCIGRVEIHHQGPLRRSIAICEDCGAQYHVTHLGAQLELIALPTKEVSR